MRTTVQSNQRIPTKSIAEYCKSHPIRRLALFGSALRDDFREDSDIDLLVEFDPDAKIGLLGKARMQADLSDLVGRQVDLRTPAEISRYFRQRVLDTAKVLYVHR